MKTSEWYEKNAFKYRGKWIAIRDGKLLGVALTLKELNNQIGAENRNHLTTVVKVLESEQEFTMSF